MNETGEQLALASEECAGGAGLPRVDVAPGGRGAAVVVELVLADSFSSLAEVERGARGCLLDLLCERPVTLSDGNDDLAQG